ncbi:hypothetical protein [Pseudalkalibacillus sp. SCS-8]|uniref:hypothetical protein n=1 Tax=Pseudalkalibacillus nanhaiensis TaxID=3115291 RepID=UPI0032D9C05C
MSTTMVTSLTAGFFIMFFFHENLFYVTLLSMLIGAVIGLIGGSPIHYIIALEGMLTGIMGGMMGVMFGAMIPVHDWHQLIRFLLLLYFTVLTMNLFYLHRRFGSSILTLKIKGVLIFGALCFIVLTIYSAPLVHMEMPVPLHHP